MGNELQICTVIGFPNGHSTSAVKVFETEDAIRNGADEIDMVINIGWVKDQRWDEVLAEIKAIKASCQGRILKVIVETCLLTEAEKIKLCELVTESGADYIKTSTGFSTGGATREDVALFKAHIGPGVKIKAAGGISSLKDAEDFMALGADRLGTSDRQAGEGRARRGILSRTERGTGPQGLASVFVSQILQQAAGFQHEVPAYHPSGGTMSPRYPNIHP